MAHSTPPGKRHPAMWQSVPVKSFIRPSTVQNSASEMHDEDLSSPNLARRDMGASKHFPPRKKDDVHHRNINSQSSRVEEPEDKAPYNGKPISGTRKHSNLSLVQKHCRDFSRPAKHPTSQHQPFFSNEDFPSLSGSGSGKILQPVINSRITAQLGSISYSAKLKLAPCNLEPQKIESTGALAGKESSGHGQQRNSPIHGWSNYGKESSVRSSNRSKESNVRNNIPIKESNMKNNHPTNCSPADNRNVSNPYWRELPRSSNAERNNYFDEINASSISKIKHERENSPNLYLNEKEMYRSKEEQFKEFFSGITEGSSMCGGNKTRPRNAYTEHKVGPRDYRRTENVKTEKRNDFSWHSKSAITNARATMTEVGERCFNTKVPSHEKRNDFSWHSKSALINVRPAVTEARGKCFSSKVPSHENMSCGQTVVKTRSDVKHSVSRPIKMAPQTPVPNKKEKHCSSEMPCNEENPINSQPGAAGKTPKKRKNRKSKLKRNAAFQTGKITILTPELYSRFTGSGGAGHNNSTQNFTFDLGDMNEYPELGQVDYVSLDRHKKSKQPVTTESFTDGESDSAATSLGLLSKQALLKDENNIKEASNSSETTEHFVQKAIPGRAIIPKQNTLRIKDKEVPDVVESERSSCALRTLLVSPQPGKLSSTEENDDSFSSEQKAKSRHDGCIEISFSDILSTMVRVKNESSKIKKQSDSKIGVISSKKVKMDKNLHSALNALDSSRPVIKRGKERERPKPKKHSALKRIILKERSEKKQRRNMQLQGNSEIDTGFQNDEKIISSTPLPFADRDLPVPDRDLLIAERDLLIADREMKLALEISVDTQDNSFDDFYIENLFLESLEETIKGSADQTLNTSSEDMDKTECEEPPQGVCDLVCEEKKLQAIQIAIHTRHFREYCNHLLSTEIDQVTRALLGDLTRFQDRLHEKDPVKARIKRRLVYGIKEVTKHLKLKKVKCVILAPDSENIKSKGGLNDAVSEIVRISVEYHIPCVFALRRKTLGKACLKPVPVSCVGVFNYSGSEANFKKLIELQAESKKAYDAVMSSLKELITQEYVEQLVEAQENSPQSLQDLRITLLREKLLEKNADLRLVFTASGNVEIGHKEE